MPGVKRLHPESSDVSKPEWIRGHYFSALGLLLGSGAALFAVPIVFKLQDGIETSTAASQALTLVDKMAALCIRHMTTGSYGLLDADYASAKVLRPFRAKGLHLISRVRISTVACAAFTPLPDKRGRGRPRKWGSAIHLQDLFAAKEACLNAVVWLYGQPTTVHYQCFELFWDSPDAAVLFVLTQLPNGKRVILLSSNVKLPADQVIEAYGKRFKIETSYRIKNQCRIRTTSKNPVVRLLFVALAFILVNLWVYLLWFFVSRTQRGGRVVYRDCFSLKTMLEFLSQAVERHFPPITAVYLPVTG